MIPSGIIWTWFDGIAGAAIAEFVIAGARLLPWYLVETRWLSRGRGQMTRIVVPLAAGLAVAIVVIWVRRVIPDDGADLALGGLAALTVMGLLVYRMRSVLAAVQETAAVNTARSFARAASPVLEAVIESPGRPMWSGVSQRTQILPPVPALVPAEETGEAGLGRKVRSGARWSMVNTLVSGWPTSPSAWCWPGPCSARSMGSLRHLPAGAVGRAQRQRDGGQPGRGALGR